MNTENPDESQTPEPVADQSLFDTDNEPDVDNDELDEDALMLDDLKNRARQLGIKFHPSIKAEALGAKIKEALEEAQPEEEPPAMPSTKLSKASLRDEALALVRVRVTCMDPLKKAHQGDIFTVGNSVIGTIKRYVPYGVEWHVPKIMLNMLQEKQFQVFATTKNEIGQDTTSTRMMKTYNIEMLQPLSEQELKDLAQRQAMAQGREVA